MDDWNEYTAIGKVLCVVALVLILVSLSFIFNNENNVAIGMVVASAGTILAAELLGKDKTKQVAGGYGDDYDDSSSESESEYEVEGGVVKKKVKAKAKPKAKGKAKPKAKGKKK